MIGFATEIESPSFELGDIVVLRSGGPDMTVTHVDLITGHVRCWWVNSDGVTDDGSFPSQALTIGC